jgi:hypothetical protein
MKFNMSSGVVLSETFSYNEQRLSRIAWRIESAIVIVPAIRINANTPMPIKIFAIGKMVFITNIAPSTSSPQNSLPSNDFIH